MAGRLENRALLDSRGNSGYVPASTAFRRSKFEAWMLVSNNTDNAVRLTPPTGPAAATAPNGRWRRAMWVVLGLGACGLGGLGLVVPGLPSTVFFILAAYCFSRSSERLLNWVLGLPKVGPLVRNYREGRGIPRVVKKTALATMAMVGAFSLVVLPALWLKALVLGLLLIGASVVWWGVPSTPSEETTTAP